MCHQNRPDDAARDNQLPINAETGQFVFHLSGKSADERIGAQIANKESKSKEQAEKNVRPFVHLVMYDHRFPR
jgi:hypothetical protein